MSPNGHKHGHSDCRLAKLSESSSVTNPLDIISLYIDVAIDHEDVFRLEQLMRAIERSRQASWVRDWQACANSFEQSNGLCRSTTLVQRNLYYLLFYACFLVSSNAIDLLCAEYNVQQLTLIQKNELLLTVLEADTIDCVDELKEHKINSIRLLQSRGFPLCLQDYNQRFNKILRNGGIDMLKLVIDTMPPTLPLDQNINYGTLTDYLVHNIRQDKLPDYKLQIVDLLKKLVFQIDLNAIHGISGYAASSDSYQVQQILLDITKLLFDAQDWARCIAFLSNATPLCGQRKEFWELCSNAIPQIPGHYRDKIVMILGSTEVGVQWMETTCTTDTNIVTHSEQTSCIPKPIELCQDSFVQATQSPVTCSTSSLKDNNKAIATESGSDTNKQSRPLNTSNATALAKMMQSMQRKADIPAVDMLKVSDSVTLPSQQCNVSINADAITSDQSDNKTKKRSCAYIWENILAIAQKMFAMICCCLLHNKQTEVDGNGIDDIQLEQPITQSESSSLAVKSAEQIEQRNMLRIS